MGRLAKLDPLLEASMRSSWYDNPAIADGSLVSLLGSTPSYKGRVASLISMCDTAHMFPYHHSRDTRQFAYHMFLDPIGTLIVLLSPLHMLCCHIILLETSHTSNLGTLYKATQVYSLLSFSYSLASRALQPVMFDSHSGSCLPT